MVEGVEDRTLLATFTVSNTGDDGFGSLRQAIRDADATPGPVTIKFAIPGAGVQTIAPVSPFPPISNALFIDGSSQPGYAGQPLIALRGLAAGIADGLTITGSGATIRDLAIGDFRSGAGIVIDGAAASNNLVAGNAIGTDSSGNLARPNGVGIRLADGAHDNTVGGTGSVGGNDIVNNLGFGVLIASGARDNVVGGLSAGDGNQITANIGTGVVVRDDGTVDNRIEGNRIFAPASEQAPGLSFDGSGGYVQLPSSTMGGAFTFEAWVQSGNVYASWARVFDFGNGPGIDDIDLDWYANTGAMSFGVQDTSGNWSGIGTSAVFPQSVWVHVAATIDAQGNAAIYWNGQQVASGSIFVLPTVSRTNEYLGRSEFPSDSAFSGAMDEVKIWSVARAPDQVRQDMTAVPSGTESGLVAYYPFDEGQGATGHDLGPNHDDATLASQGGSASTWATASGQAIDLGGDGVTANATAPRLQGPNELQDFPIVVTTPDGHLRGWLGGSLPQTEYHVEFFASSEYSSNGSGEAEDYLGSIEVTTDGSGQVAFGVPFTSPASKPVVTATATDPSGNTSELSAVRQAAVQVPESYVRFDPGSPLTLSATSGDGIGLADAGAGSIAPQAAWDLSLSIPIGTLTLSKTTGLVGTGNGTDALHYDGSLGDLNAALDGLRYNPPPRFHGQVVLIVAATSAGVRPVQAQITLTDGVYSVTTTADSGPGSLRQAILGADATPGASAIDFAILGGGVQTIVLTSPLPAITGAVQVDGTTQPGYAGTPMVELDGRAAGGDGLTITGSGATIRGLAIGGFVGGAGIAIEGTAASGTLIVDNAIGTDASERATRPNGTGIRIADGAHDNTIGGTNDGDGNLIADTLGSGVVVQGDGTVDNPVEGNRIFASGDAGLAGLSFHGSFGGNYVSLPNDLVQDSQTAETIEAWFQTTQSGVILGYQTSDPNNTSSTPDGAIPAIYVSDYSGALDAEMWTGTVDPIVSKEPVNDGRWHHVALVVDNAAQVQELYLDGRLVGSLSGAVEDFGGSYNQIGLGFGGDWPDVYDAWTGFSGQIDQVKIWSVVRTPDQIRSDMTADLAPTEPGLEAYYRFDEGQGLTAHDASSNHRDATLTGGPYYNLPPIWNSGTAQAIDLSGDGVTANGTGPREGPNDLQNFPVIVTADDGHDRGWLAGSLPDTSYHLEFFAGSAYAPDGSGEAEVYLGSLEVTTDDSGQVVFDIPFSPPADEPVVSATATDPAGNTSEFSSARHPALEAPSGKIVVDVDRSTVFSSAAGDAVVLEDPDAGPFEPVWDLSVSIPAGTLTLSTTAGLVGTGDGTGSLHYRGGLAALDAALDGLRFDPPAGFHWTATLLVAAQSSGALPVQAQFILTDGVYVVTTTADGGPGSLRQAILDADATPGATSIVFAIPGGGVHTIAPTSGLPAVTGSVRIEGTTQPGYAGTPRIELDGQAVPAGDGLTITGSGAAVLGLAIGGYASGAGILVDGGSASGNLIEADVIGTDASGLAARPNGVGIRIADYAHDNTIGGTAAGAGNLIALNIGSGVVVNDSAGDSILGNLMFGNSPDQRPGVTFDGSGGYVQLPSFSIGGAFTFEAWVKADDVHAMWARIFDFGNGPGNQNIALAWSADTGTLDFAVQDPSGNWFGVTTSAVFPQGQWVHVAATVDAQGNGAIYWDGQQVASGSMFVPPTLARTTQYLARSEFGQDSAFTGAMDEVKLWSVARTADQVRADMTDAPAGPEPDLLAYYPFDEGQGLTAGDASGNDLTAKLVGQGYPYSPPGWSPVPAQGIDYFGDGVTPNAQYPYYRTWPPNFPTVVSTADGRIRGWLSDGQPDATYDLEFFAGGAPGEARLFLGSLDVTTDDSGQAIFDLPFTPPADDPVISATATDPSGSTSELSSVRPSSLLAPTGDVLFTDGTPVTLSSANANAIALQDPDAGPLDPVWDLTLSVSAGALSLSTTAGLEGTGDGTGSLHYRGGLDELNAALEGLRFDPPADVAGHVFLTIDGSSDGAHPVRDTLRLADSVFRVTSTADSGPGSLRQAILDADAEGSASSQAVTIRFAIPGGGFQRITPISELPAITAAVEIDGTSAAGYAGTPLIVLDGQDSGVSYGLRVAGSGATIRGLAIVGFASGPGILLDGYAVDYYVFAVATKTKILGDWIGVDPVDGSARPNGMGVEISGFLYLGYSNVSAHDNTVGGLDPGDGNVIAFNAGPGVFLDFGALGNRIEGNVIYGNAGRSIELNETSGYYSWNTNNRQESPVIFATTDGVLHGRLERSLPDSTYHVEVFASASFAPDGSGQAESDLGSLEVTTDDSGQALFEIPFTPPSDEPVITATATDPQGNTSELSAGRQAGIQAPAKSFLIVPDTPILFSAAADDAVALQDSAAASLDTAWEVTLSVASGTMSLSTTAGLVGTGDGTGSLDYRGGLRELNAALDGLRYDPPADFHGHLAMTILAQSAGAAPIQAEFLFTDGISRVTTTADAGPGSLRQAILDANTLSGATTIEFAIPGGGAWTITPLSPLPTITSTVLLDGTTEPGFAGSPLVTLVGTASSPLQALTIRHAQVTIRGVSVAGFGVEVDGDGTLGVLVHPSGPPTRLTLLDPSGRAVVQSDGSSPTDPDSRIDEYVTNGTYLVQVSSDAGSFDYVLTAGPLSVTPSWPTAPTYGLGSNPDAGVSGDFNGDGFLDLAIANQYSNDLSILLGNGDGTFQPERRIAVGAGPTAVVTGDFNGDGRLDLAVLNGGSNDLSILLGYGNGTFQLPRRYPLVAFATDLAAGDFNGDGRTDLAVTQDGRGIGVLLASGDGTFGAVRISPMASGDQYMGRMVSEDFNGDGRPDLAVVGGGGYSILTGNRDGTFDFQSYVDLSLVGWSIVSGDFDGDGHLDLIIGNWIGSDDFETLVLGNGDGTFQSAQREKPPYSPPLATRVLVAGDFGPDGTSEIVTANGLVISQGWYWEYTLTLDAAYAETTYYTVMIPGDFNGDGRLDLAAYAVYSPDAGGLWTALNDGAGRLVASDSLATARDETPLAADVNNDGTPDVLEIDAAGHILYREGRAAEPGTFDPPVVINPAIPARDVAYALTDRGGVLAAVDDGQDSVSLYLWIASGMAWTGSLPTGRLPAQIVAADLNGDGRDDLVIRNAGDGTLTLYLSAPGRSPSGIPNYLPPVTLPTGPSASDVELVSTRGNGVVDIVITYKDTGDVAVLLNRGDGSFAPPSIYRAGAVPSAIIINDNSYQVIAPEKTAGIVAGPGSGAGTVDLAAINPGTSTIGLLKGVGLGRFANPVGVSIGSSPRAARMADLNADGATDLAVLTSLGVSIFLGDGEGGFALSVTYDAGQDPRGLSVADVNHDGHLDLLIGDTYGDVLVLLGTGDGTFQPYRKTEQAVAMAVADLNGDGVPDFVFASQGLDRVSVEYGRGGKTVVGDRSAGVLAPGAVQLADLNGDGIPDLIVANSGSNNLLIYPGLGGGQFGPGINGGQGYFTGTEPTGFTVADVNADGIPDLVIANTGSNDVSILLGQGSGSDWTMIPGPRIKTDGGPAAVVVGQILGDGYPDLAVANSQADNVQVFAGLGGGFFNDQNPRTFPTGQAPAGLFLGHFDSSDGLAVLDSGSNNVTLISDLPSATPLIQTVPSAGQVPIAGFVGDFNADGFTDLVVANNGSGQFSLLLGGSNGLGLGQSIASVAAPEPTSVTFAGVEDGQLSFYVSTAGREAALRLAFELVVPTSEGGGGSTNEPGGGTGAGPIIIVVAPSSADLPSVPSLPGVTIVLVARLGDVSGSSLDLIASLVTMTVPPISVEGDQQSLEGGAPATEGFGIIASTGFGQGLSGIHDPWGGSEGEPEKPAGLEPHESNVPRPEAAAVEHLAPWARLAAGLEEVWQELRGRLGAADRGASAHVAGKDSPAPTSSREPGQETSRFEPATARPSSKEGAPSRSTEADGKNRSGRGPGTSSSSPERPTQTSPTPVLEGRGRDSDRTRLLAVEAALEQVAREAPGRIVELVNTWSGAEDSAPLRSTSPRLAAAWAFSSLAIVLSDAISVRPRGSIERRPRRRRR